MLNYLGFFVATPLGGEGVTAGSEMTSDGEKEEEAAVPSEGPSLF